MALIQASIESGTGPSHKDDPFDWTVEQVVYSLCNPDSPILRSRGHLLLPDPFGFANALREEQIDGEALLTVLTLDILHSDLGVKALGVRAKIINLIKRLRQQSSKYQENLIRDFAIESRLSSIAQMSPYNTPSLHSPEHRNMKGQILLSDPNYQHTGAGNLLEPGAALPQLSSAAAGVRQITNILGESRQEPIKEGESSFTVPSNSGQETYFIDEKGRRRRHLALNPRNATSIPIRADPAEPAESEDQQELQDSEETSFDEVALQVLDRPSCLPSTAEELPEHIASREQLSNDTPFSRTTPNRLLPEEIRVGQRQRKRIQPTPVDEFMADHLANSLVPSDSGPAAGSPECPATVKKTSLDGKSKRSIEQIYFGPSAFNIDDIFYDDTTLGDIIRDSAHILTTEEQEMSLNPSAEVSDAQRRWINSKMKYFFRSTTSNLVIQDGGQEIGVIPYSNHFGKRNEPLSMTVLSRSASGVIASRVNRIKWKSAMSSTKPTHDAKTSDPFGVLDPAMAVDDKSGNWDALEKWKHIDNDKILPIYGDSGSEGEYDLGIWREMEAESGTIPRPEGQSRSRKLTSAEVKDTLDAAVKQLCDEWQLKQRPKIQHKAWRYWAKARRDHTIEVQIEHTQQWHVQLEARILGLRKEIAKEEWSKPDQIMRQSKSMQPSVFEREECQWKLGVLKSKHAPQKLPAPTRKPRRTKIDTPPIQDGEGKIAFEASSIEDEETEDDLIDFIVDDEADENDTRIIPGDEDTIMADDKDAIKSDTLVISTSDIPPVEKEAEACVETPIKTAKQSGPVWIEAPNFIDLTQVSDPSPSPPGKTAPPRIVTPPIINTEEDSDAWFNRSRGKKPVFKHPPSADAVPAINVDTDSDDSILLRPEPPPELPALNDIKRIRRLSPTELVEKQDRKRLLVWLIAHTLKETRTQVIEYVNNSDVKGCFAQVKAGLKKMKVERKPSRGHDQETSESILQVAAWYVGWTIPVKLDSKGVSVNHIDITMNNDDGFEPFHEFMLECLRHYKGPSPKMSTPCKKKEGSRRRRIKSDVSDSSTSVDLRKFASESQETLQKRDAALLRMREDNHRAQQRAQREARQKELMPRLLAMSTIQDEASEVILNPGKLDDQEFVKLDSKFGKGAQLKPHQKEGLQFMWREITGDHENLQGCLLAQTMGLGKTIQVIALLVAISDAANSSNEGIRKQVPSELHVSQTLVLCPPALIENWWDEFLMWPPASNCMGELRKVSANMKPHDRIREILAWGQGGGVLLMGYSTFRDLIQNKPRDSKIAKTVSTLGSSRLNDQQYRDIRTALLEKPNLVVADEAHEFKNQKSSINRIINQIKCKSRIALTGSPLSNNLGEYFVTIDWIAPGYLGAYSDFKSVYEDPIQEGLYQDQKPARYRESRKRLKALELELEPKIHRADPTALHGNLNGKSEFVIRVPLTTFQISLYRDFVSSISNLAGDTDRNVRTTTLWSYLSVLQLLCNHPVSFYDRLQKEHQGSGNDSRRSSFPSQHDGRGSSIQRERSHPESDALIGPSLSTSDEDLAIEGPLPQTMLSLALSITQKAFNDSSGNTSALHLSNKMQALMRIIELSEKASDKVLVFSHRLDTLDYIGTQLEDRGQTFHRINGKTPTQRRQEITKSFNEGPTSVCLISTRAGGQGLNMFGANRVVILDSHFNPMWEQQAVGRAYRIGQKKHVFVYRLTAAGTFEEEIQDQALFKEQLVTRVLEKKNPSRIGLSGAKQYLFEPKEVRKGEIAYFTGQDPLVLDHLLADQERTPITSITPSETFHMDDGQDLTVQERKEAEQMLKDEQLRRRDPERYYAVMRHRLAQPKPSTAGGVASSGQLNRPPPTYGASAPQNPSLSVRQSNSSTAPPTMTKGSQLLDRTDHGASGSSYPTPWHSHGIARVSGGPIVSTPASDVHLPIDGVEARVAYTISQLFSSSADPAKRQRAPMSLSQEAGSDIVNLISQNGAIVPLPGDTARKLRIIMDEHSETEEDYRRLWQGISKLLEQENINPNALLKIIDDRLRQLGPSEPESMRSDSSLPETASASMVEKSSESENSMDNLTESSEPVSKLGSRLESTRTLESASAEPMQSSYKLPGQTQDVKRPPKEASEGERPAKKQRTSLWAKAASLMTGVGEQSK